MQYNKIGYEIQNSGYKFGFSKAYLDYQLGNSFSSLGASGNIEINSLYTSYSIIRSRRKNLYLQISLDEKNAHDNVSSTSYESRKNIKTRSITISGDLKDNFWIDGQSSFSFTLLNGTLNLLSPDVSQTDAGSAQTNGSYSKANLNLARIEALTAQTSIRASITAQWASKNLDATEKLILGGMTGIRAYPAGEGAGDEGYIASIETQSDIHRWQENFPGYMQYGFFVDAGEIKISHNPWLTTANSRKLAAGGFSLHWYHPENKIDLKLSVAQKLVNEAAQSAPDAYRRVWLNATKFF
jgi:hemolysin activation/secretion protein